MVLLVNPIHQKAIDEDEEDKRNDAALLRKPEAERKSGSGKCVGVQAVGEENSSPQSGRRPNKEKDDHDTDIATPNTLGVVFGRRTLLVGIQISCG